MKMSGLFRAVWVVLFACVVMVACGGCEFGDAVKRALNPQERCEVFLGDDWGFGGSCAVGDLLEGLPGDG